MPVTPSQRRGLGLLLGVLVLILAIRLMLNRSTVPQPPEGPNSRELADRIDPNTASEAELAAIPSLSEKRAEAIVEYRRQFNSGHPERRAFTVLSDLEQIPGIGPATAETMEPYLVFQAAPATNP